MLFFVGHIDEGGFRGVEAFIALDDDIWSAGAIFICTIFLGMWWLDSTGNSEPFNLNFGIKLVRQHCFGLQLYARFVVIPVGRI